MIYKSYIINNVYMEIKVQTKILPDKLYKKFAKKYKYNEQSTFQDIFYQIVFDSFVLYTRMAIKFQIIKDIATDIEPNILKKYSNKFKSLYLYMDNIITASNVIASNLEKITRLLK